MVHACDRYQILFQGFEYFFERHWPDLKNVHRYCLTEEVDHRSDRFINLKTGERKTTGYQYGNLNHQQWNPAIPDLLLYAHEGTWHVELRPGAG